MKRTSDALLSALILIGIACAIAFPIAATARAMHVDAWATALFSSLGTSFVIFGAGASLADDDEGEP